MMSNSFENIQSPKRFNIPQRWVTVCLGFFGLLNAFTMRGCLSIAITEMIVSPKSIIINKSNDSYITNNNINNTHLKPTNHPDSNTMKYDWSEETQGLILSSFYWGYIFSCILGGVICQKFGGKHTLGLGILITSILTILTPYCTYWGGSTALIIMRVAMGFGEGTTFPAVTHLLAHWIPEDERSKAGTVVFSGSTLGTVFGMSISGFILQHSKTGWPVVFYYHGTVGIVFFLLNTAFCYNRPSENPYISDKELTYLNKKLGNKQNKLPAIPWCIILKSPVVWASIIGKFGFGWGYVTIISDLPKYMKSVLKLSAQNNGYLSSVPYLAKLLCSLVGSWIADKVIAEKIASITIVRKVGATLSLTVPAIFLIASFYAGSDRVLAISLQSAGIACMGCGYFSLLINALDLSPNYASSIMGFGNGIGVISGAISPYVVGVLTPNQTIDEWQLVFWIVAGVFVMSNFVFLVYGSGKVQEWNDPDFLNKEVKDLEEAQKGVELLPLKKS